VGSGFRTFTAGEVLTASNVQNYLMDQSVMVFGGSAARSSAIGTANFEEGMVSYLTDTDKVEAYNGTNWVSVAPTTSQGLTLINTTSFSAVASQSINDVFSATYDNYRIMIRLIGSSDTAIRLRLRTGGSDASGANYTYQEFQVNNATVSASRTSNSTNLVTGVTDANYHATIVLDVFNPFAATPTGFVAVSNRTQSVAQLQTNTGVHTLSTSYSGVTFFADSTFTLTGKVGIYGYNV